MHTFGYGRKVILSIKLNHCTSKYQVGCKLVCIEVERILQIPVDILKIK